MDVNLEILQANSQEIYGLDFPGGLRVATGLNRDPNGICRALWGKELNACYPELMSVMSGHGAFLTGVSGDYLSTPDHATLDITGDLDMQWEGYSTGPGIYMSKFTAAGGQRSYRMFLSAFNTFHITWSATGSANLGSSSANQSRMARRITLDVDDGSGNRVISYYFANSLDDDWDLFHQHVVAGTTSIFSGSAPLIIGADEGGTGSPIAARFVRARLYDGIMENGGTLVAEPDVREVDPGATSFVDSTGKTWTVHGNAVVV